MEKIFIIVSHEYGEDSNEVRMLGAFDDIEKAKEHLNEVAKIVREQFYYNNNEEDIESGASETHYHIWEKCSYGGHYLAIVETELNNVVSRKIGW